MYLIRMTQGLNKYYWDGIKWNSLAKLALLFVTERKAEIALRNIRRFDKFSGKLVRFEVIQVRNG
ncbi:MAG: hypothetical protein ACKPE3_32875 [Sphaerospermopsis kisseleviana]